MGKRYSERGVTTEFMVAFDVIFNVEADAQA